MKKTKKPKFWVKDWAMLLGANFDPFYGLDLYGEAEISMKCRLLGRMIEAERDDIVKQYQEVMKTNNLTNQEPMDWEREFDEKVNELRQDLGSEEVHEFGYKYRQGDEIFAVTDWGNVKAFISKWLQQEREKERERIIDLLWVSHVDEINEEDGGKYHTSEEGVAHNSALDDVISKLEEHKQT